MPTTKSANTPHKKASIEEVIDAISETIIVIDKHYKITLFNKAAEDLFGIKNYLLSVLV